MKTIVLPIIILSFFSIATFSQTRINDNVKQNRDMNGAPLNNASVQLVVPYANPSIMSEYAYDSVRELTEINDPYYADAYPWISPDGLRLYYTNGANYNQLMFTQRTNTNSYFVSPTVIPISVSSPVSYWLSKDELDVYISDGYNFFYAHRDAISSPFNTPVNIRLLGMTWTFIGGASLNASQNELFLFFINFYDTTEGMKELSRSSDTSFTYTRTLPAPSGYTLQPGQLSKDELTFFFGASYNEEKPLLYQMTRATPTDSFDISTFQQIQGINDSSVWNIQPSMSDSLNWVVFVRNVQEIWDANDLFIAHKGTITSVFNPDDMPIFSSACPNPSSDILFINYKTSSSSPLILSIYSSVGTLIYENVINPSSEKIRIDTKAMNNGMYFYTLAQHRNNKTGFGTGKFVVLH